MFTYKVSGEFAMLYHTGEEGAVNLEATLTEILVSMRRAGRTSSSPTSPGRSGR